MAKKKRPIRVDLRKNRAARARPSDLTRRYDHADDAQADQPRDERISGKGALTRKRTVLDADEASDGTVRPAVDEAECFPGRVLAVRGLINQVELDDGRPLECATRRLLKTLSTDERHVVVAGDRVWVRLANPREGIIERVEPRYGVLSRTSRGRRHIIAANVDQWLIVVSAAEPNLKPHLVDRYLVSAEQVGIAAIVCINKLDLVDPAEIQPLVGVWARLGHEVLQVSAATGLNIERLRRRLVGRQTVVTGQSGVGKSSLLNVVEPELGLRVGAVSAESEKGKHTTTTAQVVRLRQGGSVIDTPGVRQFQLWDIIPAEVSGLFRDVRPFVNHCKFPNCTHRHESHCAVKDAVADGRLDLRRYESMQHLLDDDID